MTSSAAGSIRLLYNGAVYAIGGAAAGVCVHAVDASERRDLLLDVLLGSVAFYATNIVLIARDRRRGPGSGSSGCVRRSIFSTVDPVFDHGLGQPHARPSSGIASPLLSAALIGPLVAVALYQRSVHEALKAMRLALTDPLTGLGNHRHFHERLQRDLDDAQADGDTLSICLVDIDNFKRINDRHGHPVGRPRARAGRVPAAPGRRGVPARRRRVRAAPSGPNRAGGAGRSPSSCSTGSRRRPSEHGEHGHGFGRASRRYPEHGVERSELVRVADSALYWSKEQGKGRARVYRPDVVEFGGASPARAGARPAALASCAAAGLARAVDARDAYTGEHSAEVGELAARIVAQLGLENDEVELLRLAGSLHDVGKLAIPEEILRKPGPLERGRARRPRAAPADRLPDARLARGRARRDLGPPPSRALGRSRLPEPARGRATSRSARASSSSPTPTTR